MTDTWTLKDYRDKLKFQRWVTRNIDDPHFKRMAQANEARTLRAIKRLERKKAK